MTEWAPVPDGVWRAIRHYLAPHVGASFTIPGDPVPKGRPRLGKGGNVITPQATKDAEKRVRQIFSDALPDWEAEPDCTYGYLIEFRTAGGSKVDMDNATKLIWDALNNLFYADDIQVGDSYLHLVRGQGEPGVEVMLFRVVDNGTPKTAACEQCGERHRSKGKLCKRCTTNRAAVNALLREGEEAENSQLQTKAFNYLVGQSLAGITPTYADVAIRLGTSEPRARRIVQSLIGDGRLVKDGRRYTVPRREGVA